MRLSILLRMSVWAVLDVLWVLSSFPVLSSRPWFAESASVGEIESKLFSTMMGADVTSM